MPLTRPPQLPRGTVPGPSAPSPGGNLGRLFPVVTPAPAAGMAQHRPLDAGSETASAPTADAGAIGAGQARLIVLALTLAAGIAALGTWFAAAGPARRAVSSLAHRRGRHTR